MEINKNFSLETSGILAYYVYRKLSNAKMQSDTVQNENIELPAIKEATLREGGVASVQSVKKMSEIIAEQAKKYAAAVRSGLRTPLYVPENETKEEPPEEEPFDEIAQESEEPPVEEVPAEEEPVNVSQEFLDGTEEDVFDSPVLTDEVVSEDTNTEVEDTDAEDTDVVDNTDDTNDNTTDDTAEETVEETVEEVDNTVEPVVEDVVVDDIDNTDDSDIEEVDDASDEFDLDALDLDDTDEVETNEDFTNIDDESSFAADLESAKVVEEVAEDNEAEETWECPYCNTTQTGFFCLNCGTAKPKPEVKKVEDNGPALNIASVNSEEEDADDDTPILFSGLKVKEEKEEAVAQAPAMEATEDLHKVSSSDEDDVNEFASIADFLKSL